MRDEIARAMTVIQRCSAKDAVPGGTAGIGRAWQAAHQRAVGQPCQRTGLNGRRQYQAQKSAETAHQTIDLFIQQTAHRFRVLSRPVKPVPPVINTTCT